MPPAYVKASGRHHVERESGSRSPGGWLSIVPWGDVTKACASWPMSWNPGGA